MSTPRNAPGGKGGRCVWLTTYHHYSVVVTKTRSLNFPGPLGAYMAFSGTILPLPFTQHKYTVFTEVHKQIATYNYHFSVCELDPLIYKQINKWCQSTLQCCPFSKATQIVCPPSHYAAAAAAAAAIFHVTWCIDTAMVTCTWVMSNACRCGNRSVWPDI